MARFVYRPAPPPPQRRRRRAVPFSQIKQTLTATGFANTSAFGAPTLKHNLAPTGFANTNGFGAATVTSPQTLTATGFANDNFFGAASIANHVDAVQQSSRGGGAWTAHQFHRVRQEITENRKRKKKRKQELEIAAAALAQQIVAEQPRLEPIPKQVIAEEVREAVEALATQAQIAGIEAEIKALQRSVEAHVRRLEDEEDEDVLLLLAA